MFSRYFHILLFLLVGHLAFRIDHFKTTGKESIFKLEQKEKAKLVQKFATDAYQPTTNGVTKVVEQDNRVQNGRMTPVQATISKLSNGDLPVTLDITASSPECA